MTPANVEVRVSRVTYDKETVFSVALTIPGVTPLSVEVTNFSCWRVSVMSIGD